jgi:hypothetical protein
MTRRILNHRFHAYKNSSTLSDGRQYAALTERISLPPTSFMLLHAGVAGVEIFERYGCDWTIWKQFRHEVNRLFPAIPVWTTVVAKDGTVLASVPERRVYEMLCTLIPSGIRMEVHPLLGPKSGNRSADFRLTDHRSSRKLNIEVAGMIAKDGVPRLPTEAKYRKDLVVKLDAYAAAHEPTPYLIFIDEVCGEPEKLRNGLYQAICQLQGSAS